MQNNQCCYFAFDDKLLKAIEHGGMVASCIFTSSCSAEFCNFSSTAIEKYIFILPLWEFHKGLG